VYLCVLCLNERLRLLSFHKFSRFCASFSGAFPTRRMPLCFAFPPAAAAGTYNHFYFASLSATFLRRVSPSFLQSGQQQFLMLTKFELNLPTAQGCSLNCQSAFAAVYVFSYFPFSTPFFPNLHPPGAFNLRTTSASNSTSDSTRHLALACHLPLSQFPASFLPSFTLWFSLIAYSGRIYLHMQW